ncbi:MAG: acylphosphatase [Gemmatimonadetes bacterium]|nr:acylphosphatase [Gemmatimonadota bacterium]
MPHAHSEKAFRIEGRVQGVGFRWWTRSHALRLKLEGTVRNRDDGSVEVQARGESDGLQQLERLLRSGPRGADVRTVQEIEPTPSSTAGFQIVSS